ncbi:hypothetical protein HK104_011413 [Borealophlyctis nickersoniae]|nr:hypothetical protein HK104_011413 [Borealophlyctis nickersoniae]
MSAPAPAERISPLTWKTTSSFVRAASTPSNSTSENFLLRRNDNKKNLSKCSRAEVEDMLSRTEQLLRTSQFSGNPKLLASAEAMRARLNALSQPNVEPAKKESDNTTLDELGDALKNLDVKGNGEMGVKGPMRKGFEKPSPKVKLLSLQESINLERERQRMIQEKRIRDAAQRLQMSKEDREGGAEIEDFDRTAYREEESDYESDSEEFLSGVESD